MDATDSLIRRVVCDAGPLIHLDELGCVDLLGDFAEVVVPETVWQEVQRHRPVVLAHPPANWRRIDCPIDEIVQATAMLFSLQRGEQEALCAARTYPDAVLLTDDSAARLAAKMLRIRAHGTIGILLRSLRRGLLTKPTVSALLRVLP